MFIHLVSTKNLVTKIQGIRNVSFSETFAYVLSRDWASDQIKISP